ncbi:hypothetical protein AB0424_21000 [Streptomyces sp. NPDC051180]|uniref:hypothetical protein n=1 Tax=Streptomyces sp. NPDC051180 TaxID=3155797 RepID=UPI00344EAD99
MNTTLRRTVASLALAGALLGAAATQAAAAPLLPSTESGSGVGTRTVAPLEDFVYSALQGVLNAASGRPVPAPATTPTTAAPSTSASAATASAAFSQALAATPGLGTVVGATAPKS